MAVPKHDRLILHRLAYELRYDDGFVYLDRCGQALNRLLREMPEWESADLGAGTIVHRESNRIFSFGVAKLDLGQAQSTQVSEIGPIGDFASDAEKASNVVVEELGLGEFSRIGIRAWHLFGTATLEVARQIVLGLSPLNTDSLAQIVDGTPIEASLAVTLDRPKAHWRIAVAPIEQNVTGDPTALRRLARIRPHKEREPKQALISKIKAEKALKTFPAVGVLVDIDAYIEDPPIPEDVQIAEFISEQLNEMNALAPKICDLRRR